MKRWLSGHPRSALLLVPIVLAAAGWLAPRWVNLSNPVADLLAALFAVVPATLALGLAARRPLPSSAELGILLLAGLVALSVAALGGLRGGLLPLQGLGLVGVAFALGGGIGARIEHPGHLLPALVVASAADVISVLSPQGVTHGVLQSDTALTWLVLAAPVPGVDAIAFVLGIGDLVMMALILAAASSFGLSLRKVVVALLVGIGLALGSSAWLARAVPALVPISVVTLAAVPSFRSLRPQDRRAAVVSFALAGVLVMVALTRTGRP